MSGSSAILVLEDSQEGGGDGRKAVGGVVAPRSLATFRLRLRPSDEEDDDDERTANTEEERPAAGSGRWRCRRRTKEKRRRKRRRQRGGEGGRERRLLKVGGKFGSAAKLTQLSSPLLKRNFASPNAPPPSPTFLHDVRLPSSSVHPPFPPSLSRFLACSFNPTFRPFVRRSE